MAGTQDAVVEFEVLSLLVKIAEVLNTDKLEFADCCIHIKGGTGSCS